MVKNQINYYQVVRLTKLIVKLSLIENNTVNNLKKWALWLNKCLKVNNNNYVISRLESIIVDRYWKSTSNIDNITFEKIANYTLLFLSFLDSKYTKKIIQFNDKFINKYYQY